MKLHYLKFWSHTLVFYVAEALHAELGFDVSYGHTDNCLNMCTSPRAMNHHHVSIQGSRWTNNDWQYADEPFIFGTIVFTVPPHVAD